LRGVDPGGGDAEGLAKVREGKKSPGRADDLNILSGRGLELMMYQAIRSLDEVW